MTAKGRGEGGGVDWGEYEKGGKRGENRVN